jgi:hypothetical protein
MDTLRMRLTDVALAAMRSEPDIEAEARRNGQFGLTKRATS